MGYILTSYGPFPGDTSDFRNLVSYICRHKKIMLFLMGNVSNIEKPINADPNEKVEFELWPQTYGLTYLNIAYYTPFVIFPCGTGIGVVLDCIDS